MNTITNQPNVAHINVFCPLALKFDCNFLNTNGMKKRFGKLKSKKSVLKPSYLFPFDFIKAYGTNVLSKVSV